MRSSKPKYSQMQNQELETKAFMVLAQTTQALTIPEICSQDFALVNQTPPANNIFKVRESDSISYNKLSDTIYFFSIFNTLTFLPICFQTNSQ